MSLLESLKLALDAIWAHKLRSFLTLLGVIFGVATVIVVVSIIEGFNSYVDEKISNIGTNAFSVQKYSIDDYASMEAFDKARRRNKDIKFEDLEALSAAGGAIKEVGARDSYRAEIKFDAKSIRGVALFAVTHNVPDIKKEEIAEGRSFSLGEERSNRSVCYIGSDIADELFPRIDPIGQRIKVDGRYFEVIGVAKAQGSVFGQSRDKFVTVPLTTFMNIYGSRRSLQLLVVAENDTSYDRAIDDVRTIMRTRRKLSPNESDNFGVITPAAINNLRDKIFGTIQTVAIGVTSIALVVGAIVIMNIMLVSVTERTKEIGLRKSLGAKQLDILKQFLAESVVLASLGGFIGIVIAYLIALLVAVATPIPTSLPLIACVTALFVSGAIGVISGVYPAWRASKLDPIEALRFE